MVVELFPGEVDRVNAVTARVDTRAKVKDSQDHEIQITQTDKYLILRDLETGQVTALDLTTLQVSAVMPSTPGFGVSVALDGDAAFVIDSVLGQVRQLDPRTLSPVGEPITPPRGLTPGGFDGGGLLWIAVPSRARSFRSNPAAAAPSPRWYGRSASRAPVTTSNCPLWTQVSQCSTTRCRS